MRRTAVDFVEEGLQMDEGIQLPVCLDRFQLGVGWKLGAGSTSDLDRRVRSLLSLWLHDKSWSSVGAGAGFMTFDHPPRFQ